MSIYSIPLGVSFLPNLAEGILARYGNDPLFLSQMRIFLPTKRACLTLADYFLSHSKSGVTAIPKLIPLGEFTRSHIEDCLNPLDLYDVKPISSIRRQFLLAHLILKWGQHSPDFGPSSFDHALHLAESLASFFDQLQVEQIELSALKTLVPQEFAHHWQATLSFLTLVIDQWPHILAEENVVDGAVYRNLLFKHLLNSFQQRPPETPVIVAGSSGTFTMTAQLMKIVSTLPHGSVILSGLDQHLPTDILYKVAESPTHPQHALIRLLKLNHWDVKTIQPWHDSYVSESMNERRQVLGDVFAHQAPIQLKHDAFADVSLIECQHVREEAQVIALILKDHWVHGTGDLAVITSDQTLIRYVESLLLRFDMKIDNSAGIPLKRTQPGVFFMLLVEVISRGWNNFDVLNLLKHAYSQIAPDIVAQLEHKIRGPSGFVVRLMEEPCIQPLQQKFKGFQELLQQKLVPCAELMKTHLELFRQLVDVTQHPDIEDFFAQMDELTFAIDNLPPIQTNDYPDIMRERLGKITIRPTKFVGRRIYVWGSIEARLQKTSVVIIAGLNEGTWPRDIKPDPWINRAMRADLGLPPLERRIGLNAQDFCQSLCSEHVYLTRSESADGKIQLPSRFVHMLKSTVSGDVLQPQKPYLAWARALDHPILVHQTPRPAPMPSLAIRPREMSVTHVEQLVKNPYGFYARFILGLKKLEPLSVEPQAAAFGTMVHDVLEQFKKNKVDLETLGEQAFKAFEHYPHVVFFWWPRFLRIASWIKAEEEKRKNHVTQSFLEIQGKIHLETSYGPFILKAKADRIDLWQDGAVEIIDYKTGAIPTLYQMQNGEGAQLLLEGVIARQQGFQIPKAVQDIKLSYWRLKGKKDAGEIKSIGDVDQLIDKTLDGLLSVIQYYENPAHAYVYGLTELDDITRDAYRLLARVDEWGSYAA